MGIAKSSMFPNGIKKLTTGVIDWDTQTIKAKLMLWSFDNTTLSDANRDAFNDVADLPANDRAAGATDKTLASPGCAIIVADDDVVYGSNITDITFSSVTTAQTIGGIVLYMSSASEAVSPLICYNRFTSSIDTDGSDVKVTINASGFFKASYD